MGFTSQRPACRAACTAFLSGAALLLPLSVPAQAVLRGYLYDDSTGARLRGSIVLVDPATDAPIAHTPTDSLGQFLLKVGAGQYQISAIREGYHTTLSRAVVFNDGEQMTVRIPIARDGDAHNHIGVLEHTRVQGGDLAVRNTDE